MKKKTSVLFVCTGNRFRSVAASYSLKKLAGNELIVGSAGTKAKKEKIRDSIIKQLSKHGIDISKHKQRKLTKKILLSYDLVVAMSIPHKKFMKEKFGYDAVLFNKICYGKETPILDLDEKIPDYKIKKKEADRYLRKTVDYIYDSIPLFLKNYRKYIKDI